MVFVYKRLAAGWFLVAFLVAYRLTAACLLVINLFEMLSAHVTFFADSFLFPIAYLILSLMLLSLLMRTERVS